MMLPLPSPFMTRTSCFMLRITPRTFVSNVAVIAFRGLVRDRANLAFRAGVIHRDIEAPEALDCPVDETADILLVLNIGLDEFGFGAERTEFANQCLTSILLSPRNNDAMVRLRERHRRCAAYAREGSRDEYD